MTTAFIESLEKALKSWEDGRDCFVTEKEKEVYRAHTDALKRQIKHERSLIDDDSAEDMAPVRAALKRVAHEIALERINTNEERKYQHHGSEKHACLSARMDGLVYAIQKIEDMLVCDDMELEREYCKS